MEIFKEVQPDIEKLFQVYMEWVEQVQKYPKKVLESFQERILATYDTVESFFSNWMDNSSENRRRYLKLLSELLKLTS